MRSIVSALLMTTALALSQGPAIAQENIEPVEWWSPNPFSGAYIGATAGWVHAWADQTVTKSIDAGSICETQACSQRWRFSSEDDGWAAGLHAGYNWQFGNLVAGFETDISYMHVDASFRVPESNLEIYESSYQYFGTVRGRLGWAFENVLAYGTGGFAYAGVDHKFLNSANVNRFTNHDVVPGWTAGGGIEWAIDPYTFLRVEALYVDLEDTTRTYLRRDIIDPPSRTRIRWEDEFVVTRIGFSVKLHHDEPRYEPLK